MTQDTNMTPLGSAETVGSAEVVGAMATPEAFMAANVQATSTALATAATGPILANSIIAGAGIFAVIWGMRKVLSEIGLVSPPT